MKNIEYENGVVKFINVKKLPRKFEVIKTSNYKRIAKAIKNMEIRGAPAIGAAAAFALALVAYHSRCKSVKCLIKELKKASELLRLTRPTAVNLFWAIDRVLSVIRKSELNLELLRQKIIDEAIKIAKEDIEVNTKISKIGSKLIEDGDVILTHCNTGVLATVGVGTALGIIIEAFKSGKRIFVYITETRPALQGARLTAWELKNAKVPFKLIVDSAVGITMKVKGVSKVIVGADRILRSGHVINKIGTYQIAVLAKENNVDFYVAAPTSTIDLRTQISDVIIEEREPDEVTHIGNKKIAPNGVDVYNPVFDITPPEYISGIITERGIIWPPYDLNIKNLLHS